jgi:hypothetical protein
MALKEFVTGFQLSLGNRRITSFLKQCVTVYFCIYLQHITKKLTIYLILILSIYNIDNI